eukprot:6230528-Pyramimonas_sp.AAC.1
MSWALRGAMGLESSIDTQGFLGSCIMFAIFWAHLGFLEDRPRAKDSWAQWRNEAAESSMKQACCYPRTGACELRRV